MDIQQKRIVFISYSDSNIDKVEILDRIISDRQDLIALIIANKREALKPLAEKVAQGIVDFWQKPISILLPNRHQHLSFQLLPQYTDQTHHCYNTLFSHLQDVLIPNRWPLYNLLHWF